MDTYNWRKANCPMREICDEADCRLPEGIRVHSDDRIGEGIMRRWYIDETCQRRENWYKEGVLLLIPSRPDGPVVERFLDPCRRRFHLDAIPVQHLNLGDSYFSLEKGKRRQERENKMYEQLTLQGLEVFLEKQEQEGTVEHHEPKKKTAKRPMVELDEALIHQLILDFRSVEAVAYAQ